MKSPQPWRKKKDPELLDLPQDRYRLGRVMDRWPLRLGDAPLAALTWRLLMAFALVLLVTMITWIGREGYTDAQGDSPLTFIDALYYATVSLTTTGYGDIVPATQEARLITTLVVTPVRIIFLVLLVGTTLQLLTDRYKFLRRRNKWQKELGGHTIICGFGIKGRSALKYLRKHDPDAVVVAIDEDEEALDAANDEGVGGVLGSSLETDDLKASGVESAAKVIVALDSDDDTLVTVLRIRELNKSVHLVASCREQKNEELLYNSDATEVIVSSSSAGRILGMAAQTPDAARIVNDLLTFGDGLDINERLANKPGEPLEEEDDQTAIAVIRGEGTTETGDDEEAGSQAVVFRPGDPGCEPLQTGDRVIYIDSNARSDGKGNDSRA